jgi:uncharacterized membrane protein
MYDTLLFLHVLSAFVLVTSEVIFTTMTLAAPRLGAAGIVPMRLARFGVPAVSIGSLGVLVFGVWLAIYVKGYELWDAWILVALVLWVIYGAIGAYTGRQARAAQDGAPDVALVQRLRLLKVAVWILLVLFLLDMFFKPGA